MKFREGIENLTVRMAHPSMNFDLIYPGTDFYRFLAREIQSSLTAAWEFVPGNLPELRKLEGRTVWVFIDVHLTLQPETTEDREKLLTMIRRTVSHEDGKVRVEEAFTFPARHDELIVILLFTIGPTPYGVRILHELLHEFHLDESILREQTAAIESDSLGEFRPARSESCEVLCRRNSSPSSA